MVGFLFNFLFLSVPLILWPYTSELFEFNKMVLVYLLTILIAAAWLIKSIIAKKIIFRRTILDIPLLVFLGSQILATVFSIDTRTSILGYYSRFNGGLLSTVCYSLLYWAFVSNMNRKDTLYVIRYTLYAGVLVSLYGILEHLGIDKNIWVQDVQNRVFSTLGQPNWLAAYLAALLPIAMSGAISNPYLLSLVLFLALLFTKSRSGLLGFGIGFAFFWLGEFWLYRRAKIKSFLIISSSFLVLSLLVGFPFKLPFSKQTALPAEASAKAGPALETGGTESGAIRKIVWKGALNIWKHYPIWGSGVETFAFSYYQFRPQEHNLTSEWDFIYNKAHNEYLNYLATTGAVGTLSYLAVIFFSLLQISKLKSQNSKIALLSGYISILITNFFGFSVVPVALFFFLFPAFSVCLNYEEELNPNKKIKLSLIQKAALAVLLLVISYSLLVISKYWYADILFNRGRQLNQQASFPSAFKFLQKAISLSPHEALYHNEISQTAAELATTNNQFIDLAIAESEKAIALSPAQVNIFRNRATLFLKLAKINPKYLGSAKEALERALEKAPTDAKIFYNLALVSLRTGETKEAVLILEKAIELKANYKEARYAYALVLIDLGEKQKAKEELIYILTKIDPNDKLSQQELNKLK